MCRLVKRLCCISSTDILTAEDHPVFVSGQELNSTHSVMNSPTHSKLPSEPVHPQDKVSANIRLNEGTDHSNTVIQPLPSTDSRDVERSIGATLQDAHPSSSENILIVPIDQQNVDSRGTGIDPEIRSDRCTTQVAMFERAHNFSIENAPFTNIGHQHVNINHRHVNSHGTYGLEILKEFVSFNAVHDSSAQDPERRCHPGTRKDVLNRMRAWVDDPNAPEPILWQHGPAGVGKSAIAQTISYSYGQDKVGATFFFFRSDPIRNDGNLLFPTLAWQLALSVPIVKDPIAFSLEKVPDLPSKAIEIQFDKLIAQPFLTVPGGESTAPTSTRVIIIDGLDECSDVKLQRRVLKIIGSAVANTHFPLRFIISSRPEAHIKDFFAQFKHPILQIDLANLDDAYRDIETYLTSEFACIAVEQELDPEVWPGQDIIDTLVFHSSGQFIYAATVIKYVGDEYESAVARLNVILGLKPWIGKSPFAELDALYTEILQRQPDQDFLREFLPILVARSMLVGVEDRDLDDAMLLGLDEKELRRKLRGMHSILKVDPFLDIHHKSFLDFLDNSSRSGEYHVDKHFANRLYMQLITDALVKAASRAIDQPDSHENNHFKPRFSKVTRHLPFPIELPLDDLEEILRPLQIIQEKLLQLPHMSVPWKARGCDRDECWTFYMIDELLLHLACFRGVMQLQEPKYIGIRPLTATEEKQRIPQLDLDTCLSSLLAKLRDAEAQLLLNVDTIGLVRALVYFDPSETAMNIRSITDAENLIELVFCLNKNQCSKTWFGAAGHNITRLALAIYGRVPLLPRSLFLNSSDLDGVENTYQGRAVQLWSGVPDVRQECLYAFVWGNLSHGNMTPLLGFGYFQSRMRQVSPSLETDTLPHWRQSSNASSSKIQQIIVEVADVIQYVHSLGIALYPYFESRVYYLDSDNHAIVECPCFLPICRSDGQPEYDGGYDPYFSLESNICSFGLLFYKLLFDFPEDVIFEIPVIPPREPKIPNNVWQLIQWCCDEDPKERPTIDQVVDEMESWSSFGQFTLPS